MSDSRIQGRRNAYWNGTPITTFRYFERRGDAYIFAGEYSAPGHNASTAKCIKSAIETREENQDNDDEKSQNPLAFF